MWWVSRGAWSSAPAPLWTHGRIPPLKAPLPPAPTISPGCQVSLLPVDTSQLPRFSGSSQFQRGCQCGRTPGKAVAGSGSGTWGDEAKCCKEETWEARGIARPKARVPEGGSCSDHGPEAQAALLTPADKACSGWWALLNGRRH